MSMPEPLAVRIETFSFSLGVQPKVEGVVLVGPTGPSAAERRDRAAFLRSLNVRADRPITVYPVDHQPLIGETWLEEGLLWSLNTRAVDVNEDDPSFTNRDYRHSDPTDHGNQGWYQTPNPSILQLPFLKTERIK